MRVCSFLLLRLFSAPFASSGHITEPSIILPAITSDGAESITVPPLLILFATLKPAVATDAIPIVSDGPIVNIADALSDDSFVGGCSITNFLHSLTGQNLGEQ